MREVINWIYVVAIPQLLDWIRYKVEAFEPVQWALLILGCCLVTLGAYSAWKSYRIASYSLSVRVMKFGFTFIILAFSWENVKWLYEKGMELTGNPVLAFVLILAGGFLGINTLRLILAGGKKR